MQRTRARTTPLRILVVAPSFAPGYKSGGVQRSLVALVESSPADVDLLVVTADRDADEPRPYPGRSGRVVEHGRARVLYVDPHRPRHWWLILRSVRAFAPEVTYLNSLWNRAFGLAPMLLAAVGLIRCGLVVTAPRGQLHEGALATGSRRLKSVLLPLWRAWGRGTRHVFHCSDDAEVKIVRAHVPEARCVVSLDPVQLPRLPDPWAPAPDRPRLEILHVSRLSRNKGHDLLLTALLRVCHPVRLRIIGPHEDAAYVAELRTLVKRMPPHVTVELTGPVPPGTVRDHFAAADLFAFPTHGENFGHVIPEALSASCPVLCGPDTPFTPTLAAGGGEVLDLDPGTWAEAIDRWAALPQAEMAQAHARAGRAHTAWWESRDRSHVFDLFRGLVEE